jgi:hypothetical protein
MAGLCSGHPRLYLATKAWMAATSAAMTIATLPGNRLFAGISRHVATWHG